jgi:hypothetical protein
MTENSFTPDQFNTLITMGSSSDPENHLIALTLIENADFNKHLVYILLLKKLSSILPKTWEEHAPQSYNNIEKLVPKAGVITYKKIFELLATVKSDQEQMVFFLNYFAKYLEKQCKLLGYDFIDGLEIKIKTKNEPESRIISESQ